MIVRSTTDFDWSFAPTPTARVELWAVILRKCTEIDQWPTVILTTGLVSSIFASIIVILLLHYAQDSFLVQPFSNYLTSDIVGPSYPCCTRRHFNSTAWIFVFWLSSRVHVSLFTTQIRHYTVHLFTLLDHFLRRKLGPHKFLPPLSSKGLPTDQLPMQLTSLTSLARRFLPFLCRIIASWQHCYDTMMSMQLGRNS